MSTIGDVAREAGVARSTASSVLSGKKYVSPQITERVHAAVEKLQYTVNQGARALATARTMTIGLAVSVTTPQFDASIGLYLISVTDAARELGYHVLLLTDSDGESAVREAIASRQVDGLILLNVVEDDPRLVPIRATSFPAVLIGMPEDAADMDSVDLDFLEAGTELTERAADAGHREGVLLLWPEEAYESRRTYATRFRKASRDACSRRGIKLTEVYAPTDSEGTLEFITELLSSPNRPKLLLIHNDSAVAMLPRAALKVGLRVPEDLQVGSVHSQTLAAQYAIPYSAIESEPGKVTQIAVNLLVDRINDPSREARHHAVAPTLIDRGTL